MALNEPETGYLYDRTLNYYEEFIGLDGYCDDAACLAKGYSAEQLPEIYECLEYTGPYPRV